MQIYVPAGQFLMGINGCGCSRPTVTKSRNTGLTLDAFRIDQTEVTNAMFAKFVTDSEYKTDAEKKGWVACDTLQHGMAGDRWGRLATSDWAGERSERKEPASGDPCELE